uniref:Aminoglycoside phosphotransferase domain-containing protein n=1 Tax=Candidatus Kentrum eta TaxID=2126337 RepID=A0A450UZ31_9GAMM|nr:MAG: hypothetical protein BECKH772A_GA0070896_1001714 [Candidatus Kentron sp. H]VFJ91288.1 MAG: hypothetical protein BECKH772B_GA0070898_1001614 [Candidatus Kentron sp. H]VFJ97817.1 MAG: hypothetical protein BECKH772C_GA0070978_1001614 [Candidatus Kentron sp. H]
MDNQQSSGKSGARGDDRLGAMKTWLLETLPGKDFDIAPASQDASFRRYFRVSPRESEPAPRATNASLIVMDAPPTREDSRRFVFVAALLREAGVNVPEVLATDFEQGFLLSSDLGSTHYLAAITQNDLGKDRVDELYDDAMAALLTIQASAPCHRLPEYDRELLETEMTLFPDWFLARHLGIPITPTLDGMLRDTFDFLQRAAAEQPRVFVHQDYHSRNLMVDHRHNPGILDFQDAVRGPITYDLVSLLKDVYISWPRARVDDWALGYRDSAIRRGILANVDRATWLRWFDLMGAQRHLKIAGIFARLYHRDGKPGYLADIPLTLNYLAEVCARYPELAALGGLLDHLELQTSRFELHP